MICKACGYPVTQVIKTFHDNANMKTIRKRLCVKCGLRFKTQENYNKPAQNSFQYFKAIGK
jgi:transcriptional regulator NrdR family protein